MFIRYVIKMRTFAQIILSMKRIQVLILVIFICLTKVQAQYDAALSHYFMAKAYYNPAAAGNTDDLKMLALFNQQWVGFPKAQRSFFVTADMPLKIGKIRQGVGLTVYTESIGLFQNTHVGAQYAYKHKLWNGVLSGGIQIGIVNESFKADSIYIPQSSFHQQEDEAFPKSRVNATGLDINVGLFYQHKSFYAGIGFTHITSPELQLEENIYTYIGGMLNFMGGYNIKLNNPLLELKPSVFLLTDLSNYHLDVTARMEYNKMFNGGISWKINESIGLLLGANIGRFSLGYSFGYPTTAIRKVSSGNHELVLEYRFKLNKTKTGNTKHKSVRIL